VLIHVDGQRAAIVAHSVINFIETADPKFVGYISDTFDTLMKKSKLVSEIGEKDRQLFFETMRQRIHDKKKLI